MDREKLLEDLHEILWHFPIGMSNWDKIVDIVLNSQPRREEDRAIFNDHLIPITEEQIKDGGFNCDNCTLVPTDKLKAMQEKHKKLQWAHGELVKHHRDDHHKETDKEITKRMIAAFENDWWYSQCRTHPPTTRDLRSWLEKDGN